MARGTVLDFVFYLCTHGGPVKGFPGSLLTLSLSPGILCDKLKNSRGKDFDHSSALFCFSQLFRSFLPSDIEIFNITLVFTDTFSYFPIFSGFCYMSLSTRILRDCSIVLDTFKTKNYLQLLDYRLRWLKTVSST